MSTHTCLGASDMHTPMGRVEDYTQPANIHNPFGCLYPATWLQLHRQLLVRCQCS